MPDLKIRSGDDLIWRRGIGRTDLTPWPAGPGRLTGEFLPERTGRYRAVAKFPDGTTQESRFIVFTENLEETEVATDVAGLRRLCESSGGRLIEPGELRRLLSELNNEKVETAPQTRLRPVWNGAWVFYLAGTIVRTGLVFAAALGVMLNETQHILSRLAAADRAHQKEAGGGLLLRSVKYLCAFVLVGVRPRRRVPSQRGLAAGAVAALLLAGVVVAVRRCLVSRFRPAQSAGTHRPLSGRRAIRHSVRA